LPSGLTLGNKGLKFKPPVRSPMTFSALVLTLSMNLSALAYDAPQIPGNEGQVQACVANCMAWNEKPGSELRACVAQCQDLLKQ
jgi:hypothetical protein